jgi:hypothetical protein
MQAFFLSGKTHTMSPPAISPPDSDGDDVDVDADIQMQEMMGFARFGMQKPGMLLKTYSCLSLYST